MSVLLVATLLPASAAGRSPDQQFGRVDAGGRTPDLSKLAMNRDPNEVVNIIVHLNGEPVGVAAGLALEAGREMSEAEKASARQPLLSRQASIKHRLRGLGARVEGSFTDVLNAVRVSVKAGQIGRIAALSGVTRVERTPRHYRTNENSVEYLRADRTWGRTGNTGDGVVIAVIDSGLNYYHAHFGGPGDPGFTADNGLDRSDGNFPTDKVIEGWDFVGDDYDTDLNNPNPDPDPLDCKDPASPNVQHGTHVAGTAAGYGVRANGNTYNGSYDEDTLDDTNFRIGPGIAPEASLLAYRVFGCEGGTDLVVDAIERAVRDGADVINMSLGSGFGNPDSADTIAVDVASMSGVTVVTSAGNSGASAYITGSPGAATRSISTAAMDATTGFPSVTIDMPTGADIIGINANGNTTGMPVSGDFNVFQDDPATPCNADTGEGCEEAGTHADAYIYNNYVAGQIPVTFRGFGARVDRAKQGDAQGAPAVIMVNNSASLPPFEGPIADADIPFVGVNGSDGARFFTDEGDEGTLTEGPELENPGYQHTAAFTSGGPRRYDGMLKPDVAAPGVGVFSSDGSTVDGGKSLSGTSMASPAVAGVAALVKEANPSWIPREIKAAIVGTANPGRVIPYEARLSGSGVVNPTKAVRATGFAFTIPGASSLAFSHPQIGREPVTFSQTENFRIINKSATSRTYRLSNKLNTDSLGASVSISPSVVTVPGNSRRQVRVTIEFSRADARAMPDAAPFHGANIAVDDFGQFYTPLSHVAGAIVAKTPGANNIRVPWSIVPRGVSEINELPKRAYTETDDAFHSSVRVKNYGIHDGIADVFQWGIMDANEGLDGIDIRAAGVQSLPAEVCTGAPDAEDECLVFAVNTWSKWSNASENEFDISIDTNGDDVADYFVLGIDLGLIFGVFEGVFGSVIITNTGSLVAAYFATAPTNSTTMLLPVLASDLGLDESANDTFSYIVESFEVYDYTDIYNYDIATTGIHPSNGSPWAYYRAFDPVLSNGDFVELAPRERTDIDLHVQKDGYDPALGMKGWMIVTLDDETGAHLDNQFQADLIDVGNLPGN